jgi:asparagine synthase (glutamine-hydrolysing)
MCGIIGQISRKHPVNESVFQTMRDTLVHRGPDDAASHYFEGGYIALGHRRLSFLDLSTAGRQPLSNETENVWVVFNGEIYNYLELRAQLESKGHHFKTQTDTEVLLHGYEEWGEKILDHLKGMFAFGLLDLERKRLFLARDRFGIKPLYYYHSESQFVFASELKALVACPEIKREVDPSAVADYLVYRYIPSPKTIWKGISKLPPAQMMVFDYEKFTAKTKEYWKVRFGRKPLDTEELVEASGKMMRESVSIHARSDVEVGSFLSGGYDSSAVVCFLSQAGYRPPTFSIGFEEWGESEHRYAEIIAKKFDVPFNVTLANSRTLDLLDIMPDVYDEPIADISILPTWLVSHDAAKQVKTVMSGEGADELMGGYWWQKKAFGMRTKRGWRDWFSKTSAEEPIDIVSYYADAMSMGRFDRQELEKAFCPEYHDQLPGDPDWFYRLNYDSRLSAFQSIQRLDIKCFMGELVLTKIDRASMANSLEVRVPFLDHELYEKVLSAREDKYFQPDVTKFLLHENIKGHFPREIMERPKQGFVGPNEFYTDMKLYHRILDESRLVRDGFIRQEYLQELFTESDYWRLWKLAVLEKWYRRWVV